MKRRSVAEARASLPALLDDVERGHVVEISRRGKAVAWLVPPSGQVDHATAKLRLRGLLDEWRARYRGVEGVDRAFIAGLRDRSETGR